MKTINKKYDNLFTSIEEVPKEYKLDGEISQDEYLINGTIKHWKGQKQDVYSPVCLKDGKQLKLGTYPKLTQNEAQEALDSAIGAYNYGMGEWPQMKVADRIKAVEKFTFKMIEKREEVVNLLMWEIGKPLKDSQKEFDRTVDYIKDTIEALKTLDRKNSQLEIESGILAQVKRLRLLNGIPFALMKNYMDYEKVPNIEKNFNIESLYTYLKDEYEIEFYNAQETVEAMAPTKKEAKDLNIKDSTPLLCLDRLSFDKENIPVEYSEVRIKADMYQHKIYLHNDNVSNNPS